MCLEASHFCELQARTDDGRSRYKRLGFCCNTPATPETRDSLVQLRSRKTVVVCRNFQATSSDFRSDGTPRKQLLIVDDPLRLRLVIGMLSVEEALVPHAYSSRKPPNQDHTSSIRKQAGRATNEINRFGEEHPLWRPRCPWGSLAIGCFHRIRCHLQLMANQITTEPQDLHCSLWAVVR